MSHVRYMNDGTRNAPALRVYLNLGTLTDLPDWSTAPRGSTGQVLEAIKAAGFDGVQGGSPAEARAAGLGHAGGGRVNRPADADTLARSLRDQGTEAGTLHVAWGLEDDAEVDALVAAVVEASAKHVVPLFIETHRATITQDIWRTVQIARRHPGVRFNADFSHWYTGLEMVYGGVDTKLAAMGPVFDRVGFMHGRIGNPGCMQVTVEPNPDGTWPPFVEHFRTMWSAAMRGFLTSAGPGDYLVFAPELLHPSIYYARTFPTGPAGEPREECDRWQQALLYAELARDCFAAAQR